MSAKYWDDRTEWTDVECLGGPWDGRWHVMAPGVRTVRDSQWRGDYYEIMRYRAGYALVWQGGRHRFAHHIAARAAGEV
ncbi:MAG TPA: hypothetical protein DGD08_01770 [Gemmatimonas aurantiaca]|uniref:Uncharacterized protein n=2 Tax=Gemmatimonas aurantiaca TaxID=173480 RepID=C1A9W1_GEMAT|nr:hypothetical protein [Gemmatimonas aurantiaca]BAH39288.1 hypothetical protein GAU_2246 [Gemmatimonas aurantiaca T-27]HCT55921.1 hypothetical protein [Gemmatimonas aurantiaca]